MKKRNGILCILLAALLLTASVVMSACTVDEDNASATGSQADVSEDVKAILSGNTYGGKEVNFLTCGVNPVYNSEVVPRDRNAFEDEQNPLPDVVDKALQDRIRYVESVLDVTITETYIEDLKRYNGIFADQIRLDFQTGLADYHVIVPCLYDGATLSQNGTLWNLYELENLQTDAPWWNQIFNQDMTINGQLYFSIGDIGIVNKSATSVMLYNKELFRDLNLADTLGGTPYELVRNGNWTLDALAIMQKSMTEDLDDDHSITYKDRYGWGGQLGDMSSLFFGSGERVARIDESTGYPMLSINTERASRVVGVIQEMMQDKTHYVIADDYFGIEKWPDELLRANFIEGKSLVYSASISTPINLSDMKSDFGMVPIPKADAEQDGYHSLISAWSSTCFAVPKVVDEDDIPMIVDVLNLMGEASVTYLKDAYLEQCIELMKTRDEETTEMIENYILPSRRCDMGMVYKWGSLHAVLSQLPTKPVGTFTSTVGGLIDGAQAALDETILFYQSAD